MKTRIIVPLLLQLLLLTNSTANDNFKDSKGKEFWISFPPNYHNEVFGTPGIYRDSLYIFIAAQKPTVVQITANDKTGQKLQKNLQITDASKVYSIGFPWAQYEINGINYSGDLPSQLREDQQVIQKSFYVTSNEEITVYATSHAQTTTDATLILPTDALGKFYVIASYNSDVPSNVNGATPSQFVITATENGTNVTITPSCLTTKNSDSEIEVTLNKGDAYLVQASIELQESQSDLSGSIVKSDKPIAVFSGHQRALIPHNLSSSGSRDMLFEQLPSVETWGKNAIVIPAVRVPFEISEGNDLIRVYAAYDTTMVNVNGLSTMNLEKGKFLEFHGSEIARITSNKPIQTVYYRKTSGNNVPPLPISDPFMMVIPPVEQFIDSCTFLCPDIQRESTPQYVKHYVALVVESQATESVFLDGKQIDKQLFLPVPNSAFSYSTVEVSAGSHEVKCQKAMGVYVYGYGEAVSYGYVGGMKFEKINEVVKDTCDRKNVPIGLPNTYYVVSDVNRQTVSVTVENSQGLCGGDKVLLIQMQGADINTSNDASYGQIKDLRSSGNYEFNRIKKIEGNKVYLVNTLLREYDPTYKVQLIRVPEFENFSVNSPLTCKAWDGTTGGVLAFSVQNTLTLYSFIDATGKGFRGGRSTNAVKTFQNHVADYFALMDSTKYSRKGEGIYMQTSPSHLAGRGAAATGGGGGNNHNAGGGGGSNIGCGGKGGFGWVEYAGNRNDAQGIGGYPITTSEKKIFMGGGGGAGHSNELSGTNGGNGGGIIIIQAGEIRSSNNQIISSRGEDSKSSPFDGVGGAGAGGTIIIDCKNFSTPLLIDVRGGGGGSLTNHKDGPGGGGGGGLIAFTGSSIPNILQPNISAGGRGTNTEFQGDGAQNGCIGMIVTNYKISGDSTIVISSVEDEIEKRDVLYPNPSFNYVIVSTSLSNFVVVNSLGESITIPFTKNSESIVLDTSELPNGVYTITTPHKKYSFIVLR